MPWARHLGETLLLAVVLAAQPARTPGISNAQRSTVQHMLADIQSRLLSAYYDPTFGGMNIKARYTEYEAKLRAAPTLGAAFIVIANYLQGLHNSHTFFVPPEFRYNTFYGFGMLMIAGHCFVVTVRPGSDAAKKVHLGDEVLALDGIPVSPANFNNLEYLIYELEPQTSLNLRLRSPVGVERQVTVISKLVPNTDTKPLESLFDPKDEEDSRVVGDVFVWEFPSFMGELTHLDGVMRQARRHAAIVLDLRGNGGGAEANLRYMLGFFIRHKILMDTEVGRKGRKPDMVKPHGEPYTGKLIVLIDHDSASAAEIFARVVQLDNLGTVVGDRSAGEVGESNLYPMRAPGETGGVDYAVGITVADMVMSDGKSLENVGVQPDLETVPTAADLAAGRDPVLAEAVEMAGGKLDPTAAGKLFPVVWAPYQVVRQ